MKGNKKLNKEVVYKLNKMIKELEQENKILLDRINNSNIRNAKLLKQIFILKKHLAGKGTDQSGDITVTEKINFELPKFLNKEESFKPVSKSNKPKN